MPTNNTDFMKTNDCYLYKWLISSFKYLIIRLCHGGLDLFSENSSKSVFVLLHGKIIFRNDLFLWPRPTAHKRNESQHEYESCQLCATVLQDSWILFVNIDICATTSHHWKENNAMWSQLGNVSYRVFVQIQYRAVIDILR